MTKQFLESIGFTHHGYYYSNGRFDLFLDEMITIIDNKEGGEICFHYPLISIIGYLSMHDRDIWERFGKLYHNL